jgi:hypothetical protein
MIRVSDRYLVSDAGGHGQAYHDQRLLPVGLHDQHVPALQPVVELAEAIRPRFRFLLRRRLRRSHPHGRKAWRPAGAGADQVRVAGQPQDRKSASHHSAAVAACAPTR